MIQMSLSVTLKRGNGKVPHTYGIRPEVTLVDDIVFASVNQYRWFLNNGVYVARQEWVLGKHYTILLHNEVMNIMGIPSPGSGYTVDHGKGGALDNQVSNLRWATKSQQALNRKGYGVLPKGVRKHRNKFQASLWGKTRVHLGTYDTPEEAGETFKQAWIKQYSGESWVD